MPGVLELLITRFFSTHLGQDRKLDNGFEHEYDSPVDALDGTTYFAEDDDDAYNAGPTWFPFLRIPLNGNARSIPSSTIVRSSSITGRSSDITNWGSYVEHAPPVLPQHASAPGYEPLSRRRRRRMSRGVDENDGERLETDVDDDENGDDDVDDDDEHDFDAENPEMDNAGVLPRNTADLPSALRSAHESDADASSLGMMLGESRGLSRRTTLTRQNRLSFPPLQSLFPLFISSSTSTAAPSSSLFGSTTRPASDRTIEGNRTNQVLRRASDFYLRWENWVPTSSATREGPSVFSSRTGVANVGGRTNGSVSASSATRRHLIATMAPKTHTWVSLWFLLTAPVIFWDATYCFMRPRSMRGGDLHWLWKPYSLYQDVDFVYGLRSFESGDGFTNAQSALNIVETLLNLYYLTLQHVSHSPVAPLVGLASAVMTLWKTVLYWAQEYYCGFCAVGHNDWWTLFWLWIVPNGLWLVFPSLIILTLAKDISRALHIADKGKKPASKKQ